MLVFHFFLMCSHLESKKRCYQFGLYIVGKNGNLFFLSNIKDMTNRKKKLKTNSVQVVNLITHKL